jgi:AbrB family looped-hinge helix DNA binding protein
MANTYHLGTNLKLWQNTRIMPDASLQQEVHLSAQGRVVIPVALRRALGFHAGDALVARNEDGRLVIEKADIIKQRLKARFTAASDRSLASELMKDRHDEAKKENRR